MAKPELVTVQMVLDARSELKSLLAELVDKESAVWPIDTHSLCFYQLGTERVPQPNYGFGVQFKETGLFALWYRENLEPDRPLKIFMTDENFSNAVQLN